MFLMPPDCNTQKDALSKVSATTKRNVSVTTKRNEAIIEFKKKFLLGKDNADPRDCEYISKAVAESWLRSREKGINPYHQLNRHHIPPEEYKKIIKKNKHLIEVTKPLMKKFKEMTVLPHGYIFYLCDSNGTFLLQVGEMTRVSTEGLIWNEDTIGTCAHSICVREKKTSPINWTGTFLCYSSRYNRNCGSYYG